MPSQNRRLENIDIGGMHYATWQYTPSNIFYIQEYHLAACFIHDVSFVGIGATRNCAWSDILVQMAQGRRCLRRYIQHAQDCLVRLGADRVSNTRTNYGAYLYSRIHDQLEAHGLEGFNRFLITETAFV